MNTRFITETEIHQHQFDVRTHAHRARHSFTVRGVRHLIGNTFIALGMRLQGLSEDRSKPPVSRRIAVPAHSL